MGESEYTFQISHLSIKFVYGKIMLSPLTVYEVYVCKGADFGGIMVGG